MLRIHTGLRKLSKKNVYELHLLKMNPFEIGKPCIIIARENCYLKNIEWFLSGKIYNIEVQNDDATKRNRIFFDFMQRTFNHLDGLYLHEELF